MPHYTDYGGSSYAAEGDDSDERDSELGENIYLRENSIYTIVDGPLTWSEAEKQAQALGGHLVSLNSEDESDFVLENFSNLNDLVNNQGNFHTFLGIYDDADGNFLHIVRNQTSIIMHSVTHMHIILDTVTRV